MKIVSSFTHACSCLFVLIVALASSARAQTVTLLAAAAANATAYSTAEVLLAAGDVAQIVSVAGQVVTASGGTVNAVAEVGSKEIDLGNSLTGGSSVAGPARIRAKVSALNSPYSGIVTVNVVRANAVPTITPQNAAVIPADATGSFSVILESSTDLITWTAATPGTYSGTTEKRFFRTRIVRL